MRVKMQDLPPAIQAQVREQLAKPAALPNDGMNKLERAYMQHLAYRVQQGEIRAAVFGVIKLQLAPRTWYSPDFLVIGNECVELHETKGFMRDDAAVKLKVAARMFPWFVFKLVRRIKGKWDIEAIARR